MTQAQDPFKDFEPIDDSKEIEKFLWEAGKTLAQAYIWVPSDPELSHRSYCLSVEVDPKRMTFWVSTDFDIKPWINYWATQTRSQQFALFNLSLSRATLFFRAKFIGHDAAGLIFEIPGKVFKVQRRKDVRLPIPDGYTVRVEFQRPGSKRLDSPKLIDVSAGGLAFAIPEGDQQLYPPGTILQKVRFILRGREFKVDCEVRHSHTLSRDSRTPGYKIGVIFKDIKAGDSQALASYVFEESRKLFARIMGAQSDS